MAFWPTAVLVIFLYSIHRCWSLCHKTERESQIPLPYASHFFLFWNAPQSLIFQIADISMHKQNKLALNKP